MTMSNKHSLVEHGIDVLGDEWDVDIPEESLKQREQRKGYNSSVDFEHRIDPTHPYCTNWPVGHERRSDNIHSGVVRNNSDNNSNKQSEGIQTTPEKD